VRGAVAWAADRLSSAGLHFGHGTDNAADEAAFVVLEGLGLPVDRLEPVLDRPLNLKERRRLVELIDRRVETRMPSAYLLGRAYVGGFGFASDARALVPRSFIGELLAAGIGADAPLPFAANLDTGSILELGTGCGCLAILAALAFPDAAIDAVDISSAALDLARINVDAYRLAKRINLIEGDLYAPVAGKRYDLIIANPPYVDAEAMAALPGEYRHEPAIGLAGGADGLDLVRVIVKEAARHLNPGGGLLCEIGQGQGRLIEAFPDTAFLWLDSAESQGEMFWLDAGNCPH
jgi:ribosomal protein L3 glutamine methyltransferase